MEESLADGNTRLLMFTGKGSPEQLPFCYIVSAHLHSASVGLSEEYRKYLGSIWGWPKL